MRHRRSAHPQLEALESLTLLSAVSALVVNPSGPMVAAEKSRAAVTPISLSGILEGDYHVSGKANADKGLNYVFTGDGTISGLGYAQVAGNLHSVGNIAKGHATGLVVLSTAYGSVRLDLTGATQKGPATLPESFTFKITTSSGKYRGDVGTGTVYFVRAPAGTSTSDSSEQGGFALVFVS